jgi:Cupin domain
MEDMKTNRIQQSYDSPEFLKLIAASNAEVFYVISGHTDFLRVDENGREEWVRCGAGDTLVAPMNALHAFHNRTDKPTRLISSSVYYHEIVLETFGKTVDVNDPLFELRRVREPSKVAPRPHRYAKRCGRGRRAKRE